MLHGQRSLMVGRVGSGAVERAGGGGAGEVDGMRRWLTALALVGTATLALAGCSRPTGVDGNLTDDWAAIAAPKIFVPKVATCHPRFQEVGYLSAYEPVDCAQRHQAETAHVGSFRGPEAELTTPPAAGSPPMREAYRDCDKRVTEFVGADWRTGRLSMIIVPPSSYGWTGGARWYRCDVIEVDGLDDAKFVDRSGSLKDALRGRSALAHGCFTPKVDDEDVRAMVPVGCTKPHRSEFVGVYKAPEAGYTIFDQDPDRIHRGCYSVIARFADVPNDGSIDERVGSIYYYPSESEWKAGNRGIQCFLWIEDRDLTRSLKDAGTGGLPLR
jgi:Septum formation